MEGVLQERIKRSMSEEAPEQRRGGSYGDFAILKTRGSFPRLAIKGGQAVVYSLISIAACTNGRSIKRVPYHQDWYCHIIDADS